MELVGGVVADAGDYVFQVGVGIEALAFGGLGDCKQHRRGSAAVSHAEIAALLKAAETRPLNEALTIRRGKRKGQLAAKVKDTERKRLIEAGRTRALIYRGCPEVVFFVGWMILRGWLGG